MSQPLPSLFSQLCEPLPPLAEARALAQLSLSRLSPVHRRLEQPELYQVGGRHRSATRPVFSVPTASHRPLLSSLQVALSEKLQALVERLRARGPQ